MVQKSGRLNKKEVGTTVPTSDGDHPHPKNQKATNRQNPGVPGNQLPKIPLFWLIIWCTLFFINITLGFFAPNSDFLTLFRISGIALCLLYVVKTFPTDHLLLAAMFTTCISDIILAFNNTSEPGLITFLAVQIIHLFRLAPPHYRRHLTALASAIGAIIALDFLFSLIPLLFLVASLYAITLTLNVIASFHWLRTSPKSLYATFAFFGFTLFACCDLCTAVSYLSLIAVLPTFLYAPANFFAWFFYYPSQVLVSNSSKPPEPHEVYP